MKGEGERVPEMALGCLRSPVDLAAPSLGQYMQREPRLFVMYIC
jgi:hypothetical protein